MLSNIRGLTTSRFLLPKTRSSSSSTMSHNALPRVVVEITSDNVCPFCYLGKKRLETAIQRLASKAEFEVRWLPFQLNPDAPKEGVNKLQYYYDKFGPRADGIIVNMKNNFLQQGLAPYNVDGLVANTLQSHRLVKWAWEQGGQQAQNDVVDALMKGYFTEAKNLGDRQFLLDAAASAGLDRAAAAAYLDDPTAGVDEIQAELVKARRAQISGVPHFVVDGKFRVSGAQPAEVFVQLFEDILQQREA